MGAANNAAEEAIKAAKDAEAAAKIAAHGAINAQRGWWRTSSNMMITMSIEAQRGACALLRPRPLYHSDTVVVTTTVIMITPLLSLSFTLIIFDLMRVFFCLSEISALSSLFSF